LALLAKPMHLLFFYAIIGAVCWRAKSMKDLLHPAHFVGFVLMAGIFLAWFVPYIRAEEASEALKVWKGPDRQPGGREQVELDGLCDESTAWLE
jgi:hypothetical protein